MKYDLTTHKLAKNHFIYWRIKTFTFFVISVLLLDTATARLPPLKKRNKSHEKIQNSYELFETRITNKKLALISQGFREFIFALNYDFTEDYPMYFSTEAKVYFLPNKYFLDRSKIYQFTQTLTNEKIKIQKIYNISSTTYNYLAYLALGILGAETQFFSNYKFLIKETFPETSDFLKLKLSQIRNKKYTPLSRGPTNIKIVPELIQKHYSITRDHLNDPAYAAIATVGFLAQSLDELKKRARNNSLTHIHIKNYHRSLAYLYLGLGSSVSQNITNPDAENYIQKMTQSMRYFTIFVKE